MLSLFAAGAGFDVQVVGDGVDIEEDLHPASDQCGTPDRPGDLAPFDEVSLSHSEDELARGGIDLSPGQRLGVEGAGRIGDDLLGRVRSRTEIGVGHPGIGQMPEVLPATVAGERQSQVTAAQPVGEVAGQDAGLDHRGALTGHPFVVAARAAPHPRPDAVVEREHVLAGHPLPFLSLPDAGLLEDVVGFQPMPAGLVEQHAAEAVGQHHGHAAGRGRNRIEHDQSLLRGGRRERGNSLLFESRRDSPGQRASPFPLEEARPRWAMTLTASILRMRSSEFQEPSELAIHTRCLDSP